MAPGPLFGHAWCRQCECVIGEPPGDCVQAIPTLIELMKDPSVVVRDTTAWTVGRICELLPEAAINELYLPPLLQCLIEGLGAEPRVASNVCWVSITPQQPLNRGLALPVAAPGTAATKKKPTTILQRGNCYIAEQTPYNTWLICTLHLNHLQIHHTKQSINLT